MQRPLRRARGPRVAVACAGETITITTPPPTHHPEDAAVGAPPAVSLAHHALFLDFDGTLAPIAPRPDDAAVPAPVLAALQALHADRNAAIAIVTGRRLQSVDRLLAPLVLPAAGSHGLERRAASGTLAPAAVNEAMLADAIARFAALAREHDLLLEEKLAGASLHYRGREALEGACLALADDIEARHPALRVIRGKRVIEVLPRGVDKGTAVAAFMGEPPFAGRVPVAVGDDRTDEDAFAAAARLGGFAIRIGEGDTVAAHRFATIDAFHDWFLTLARGAEASA